MEQINKNLRIFSIAVLYDYNEFWREVEEFSDYMISNHKHLYKKSIDKYFYGPNKNVNKLISLLNDNGNKEQKQIIKLIKDGFQIKYDYIYCDERDF